MKEIFSKFAPPVILGLISIVILILWQATDQNSVFMFGGLALLIISAILLLNTLGFITNKLSGILSIVLVLVSVGLVSMNYKSINDPILFLKEKERRYTHVIQRLKDIREAEVAYKKKYKKYTNSFDTLVDFLQNDSLFVIKKFGSVPDSLTEAEAIEQGIYRLDTTLVPSSSEIFNKTYLSTRSKGTSLVLDSLPYVPFTTEKFELKTSSLERGSGITVNVFECKDSAPFDKKDVMKVGSLTDPTTAGNWKEEK